MPTPGRMPIPPLSQLYRVYLDDNPSKTLRYGQWFYNRFLKDQYGPEIDTLYNSTDFDVIFGIIEKMYRDYHWPLWPLRPW